MSVSVPRLLLPAVAAASVLLAVSACTSSSSPQPGTPSAQVGAGAASSSATSAVPQQRVTKLMVVMIENHSFDQLQTQLPYTFGLAQDFGYATQYAALTHPSLPNYLAIVGGSTFGVTDDAPPPAHPVQGQSVFGQALAAGQTATLYAEGMPSSCALENGGERYGVRHNPWAYFADERAACQQHDTTLEQLAADVASGDLPNAGMLVPDTCHDAHDCDLSVADEWLRTELPLLMSGPDWRSGRLAIVVTADEDDHSQGNVVLTTVLHPAVRGVVVDSALTHYSLTRLYDEVLGAAPLRAAGSAPSMAQAFGLPVAGLA